MRAERRAPAAVRAAPPRAVLPQVGWLAIVFIIAAPYAVLHLGNNLDASWRVGLALAAQQHVHWGTQIAFNYGPLGYLAKLDYVLFPTWLAALAANLAVHLCFVSALFAYFRQVRASWFWWLATAALLLLPDRLVPDIEYEAQLAASLLLLIAAFARGRRGSISAIAAGIILGAVAVIKDTALVTDGGLLLVGSAVALSQRRPRIAVAAPLSAAVALLVLWLIAGQPLGDLGAFLRTSGEIITGYGAAMSTFTEFNAGHPHLQLALAVILVSSMAAVAILALAQRQARLAAMLFLGLVFVAVMYKESFVRFGARTYYFYPAVAIFSFLVLVETAPDARRLVSSASSLAARSQAAVALFLTGAVLVGAGDFVHKSGEAIPWPRPDASGSLASYRSAAALILEPERRTELTENTRARLRDHFRLPAALISRIGTGSVDVVPYDIAIVYAYGLRWDPRPVLQSYSVHTRYLDQLDARHFAGARAPQYVLFYEEEIDGRYPLYDEPSTLQATLQRYAPQGVYQCGDGRRVLLLERKSMTAQLKTDLGVRRASYGEWVEVPAAAGAVYAQIREHPTVLYEVVSLLYRPAEQHLQFNYGVLSPAYRVTPALLPDGLLVSPYLANVDDLARFMSGGMPRPVRAFQIMAGQAGLEYGGSYDVRFYSMTASS